MRVTIKELEDNISTINAWLGHKQKPFSKDKNGNITRNEGTYYLYRGLGKFRLEQNGETGVRLVSDLMTKKELDIWLWGFIRALEQTGKTPQLKRL